MNFDKQVERVMREWKTRQQWRGELYGSGKEELEELAIAAVKAMNAPLQWAPGETIPDAVIRVQDSRGVRWWRERENPTEHGWSAFVPDGDFLTRVGEVTEVPEPTTEVFWSPLCSAHGKEKCTWCAQTALGGLEGGQCRGCDVYGETGMHWDTCQYRVRLAPPDQPKS